MVKRPSGKLTLVKQKPVDNVTDQILKQISLGSITERLSEKVDSKMVANHLASSIDTREVYASVVKSLTDIGSTTVSDVADAVKKELEQVVSSINLDTIVSRIIGELDLAGIAELASNSMVKESITPEEVAKQLMSDQSFLKKVKGEKGAPGIGAGGGAGRLDVQDLPGYRKATPGQVFGVNPDGNVGFVNPTHEWGDITGTLSDQTDLQLVLDTIGIRPSATVTSTTYTALVTAPVVLVDDDTAGSTVTISLPPASSATGRSFFVKKLGNTANVIIDPDGSETIDGASTFSLIAQHESVQAYSNGTFWSIL